MITTEIALHQFQCGHIEIVPANTRVNPLCPRCDAWIATLFPGKTPVERAEIYEKAKVQP
jgi:hypothetical protein